MKYDFAMDNCLGTDYPNLHELNKNCYGFSPASVHNGPQAATAAAAADEQTMYKVTDDFIDRFYAPERLGGGRRFETIVTICFPFFENRPLPRPGGVADCTSYFHYRRRSRIAGVDGRLPVGLRW